MAQRMPPDGSGNALSSQLRARFGPLGDRLGEVVMPLAKGGTNVVRVVGVLTSQKVHVHLQLERLRRRGVSGGVDVASIRELRRTVAHLDGAATKALAALTKPGVRPFLVPEPSAATIAWHGDDDVAVTVGPDDDGGEDLVSLLRRVQQLCRIQNRVRLVLSEQSPPGRPGWASRLERALRRLGVRERAWREMRQLLDEWISRPADGELRSGDQRW